MKARTGAPERGNRYIGIERLWNLAFYLAATPRSCTIPELMALLSFKWHIRTLRRDLDFWIRFGVVESYCDRTSVVRFKWIGGKKPFVRVGQIYCRGCGEFKEHREFVVVKGNYLPRCLKCNSLVRLRWHYRHHIDALKKAKGYRTEQILCEIDNEQRRKHGNQRTQSS